MNKITLGSMNSYIGQTVGLLDTLQDEDFPVHESLAKIIFLNHITP